MSQFVLDPRLENDTLRLGRFAISEVLLMKDARFPWVILVPARADVREIFHLSEQDQQQLLRESSYVAERMSDAFKADSMNVAALGNVVAQLHVHHVVRHQADPCWPGPVWGQGSVKDYTPTMLADMSDKLKQLFSDQWVSEDHAPNALY